jgi:Fic family protein
MVTRTGTYITQPAGFKAFIPKPLPPAPEFKLDNDIIVLLSKSDRALALLDAVSDLLPNPDLFIATFVKKEAVLSSQIEGTEASLRDVLEFEAGIPSKNVDDVAETVSYVRALNYGLHRLKTLPLSLRLIREVHKELMKNARGATKAPGEFRKTQNWIGAPGSSIADASFVPPPPHEMLKAMGDLEKYLHKDNGIPILVRCALIHAQFETIHPFLDGNGRIGRLLITHYLCASGLLKKPILYLSLFFKRHRVEYYDKLNAVRHEGGWEDWTRFFLRGIIETCAQATTAAERIMALYRKHYRVLIEKDAASALTLRLLEYLYAKPILSVNDVIELLKVTKTTANTLMNQFERFGFVNETTGQQRRRLFAYKEYLHIIEAETTI